MIFPQALKVGDKIGFFSPSSPATAFAPNRFRRAKSCLESQGFELVEGHLTGCSDSYRSGSILERAEEFNRLIRDPNVRCIMSTIGGSNSNSLLPYIDYEALRNDPKIIIGYSDVTALLLGIYAQTGLITFYGPALVASFGEFPPLVEETLKSFLEILCSESDSYQYTMPSSWTDVKHDWETQDSPKTSYANEWQFLGNGQVSGRIIGGNLNTMAGIWGSQYMPKIEPGDILLLEDSLKGIETVERSFAHLMACGVFEKVGAIVLGKHELFNDKGTGRTPLDVLLEVLNGKNVPILYGFDSCHTHPMLVTPLGVHASIDFDSHTIGLESQWVTAK
ncbi:TPA: LD-carboxypeptidase [Vibrio parahaemolyticus]|uniref:S66 family peptidase n=1 Tax=Vibrio parahaemolyticus TaxID=670 RepID=UPI000944CEB3|nr:S66 peptidase family protein [Vibrio parahaemolyticus]OKY47570.1 LD-carboxypeptidase [Vibrio parahaemolyticus]HCE2579730.1 LD-carboxypeptidase [Vibrio parahaemolyticus]HCE2726362.1 LD-carboxypeptidase [Vibrio parahaemolyticus]HCE2809231.1 LD-carboxypeptidase [Vibrio parahaemolyticus]HCG8781750.1 LD-carboxypeptidase [Vibrio parahaemolyticus]